MRFILFFLFVLMPALSWAQETLDTRNVFLITFDGLRWQEMFTGADASLIANTSYVTEPDVLKERFWIDNPVTRSSPFFS